MRNKNFDYFRYIYDKFHGAKNDIIKRNNNKIFLNKFYECIRR